MKELVIPILNNEYKVIVCFGGAREVEKCMRLYKYPRVSWDISEDLENMRGRTYYHPLCHPIILLPKKPKTAEDMGTLAHESVHAIKHIFDKIEESSIDEVFAHSVGAVVRGVMDYKSLKEKK